METVEIRIKRITDTNEACEYTALTSRFDDIDDLFDSFLGLLFLLGYRKGTINSVLWKKAEEFCKKNKE